MASAVEIWLGVAAAIVAAIVSVHSAVVLWKRHRRELEDELFKDAVVAARVVNSEMRVARLQALRHACLTMPAGTPVGCQFVSLRLACGLDPNQKEEAHRMAARRLRKQSHRYAGLDDDTINRAIQQAYGELGSPAPLMVSQFAEFCRAMRPCRPDARCGMSPICPTPQHSLAPTYINPPVWAPFELRV